MSFEYDLDMSDYRNYLVYHVANSKTFHNAFRNRLIISIIFLIIFYWGFYRIFHDLLYVILGAVFLVLFIIFSKRLSMYFAVERDLNKVNSEQFSGHYIADLRELEIYMEIIKGKKRRQLVIEWSAITAKDENDWYYFLYHGTSVSIFPKYYMPSDYQQFIDNKLAV
ncbi:hypothetical protein [Terribacillus saccharophilus]|uniref:hypothetical protein n=1 Tax=Terribacillus saccharophilus TaxID=361277 RepID=UPI002989ECCC|nr:hypothetical protein [Terribacillus saccharophilus]MCM3225734.1 hypothetical protein [Terribacillus saccharophilus]